MKFLSAEFSPLWWFHDPTVELITASFQDMHETGEVSEVLKANCVPRTKALFSLHLCTYHDRGWDGWMASLIQYTWVWASSGSWWWTGKPGVLQSMGSQRVRHNWVTELNYSVWDLISPTRESNLWPLQWKLRVLTTRLPGKSLLFFKRLILWDSVPRFPVSLSLPHLYHLKCSTANLTSSATIPLFISFTGCVRICR